MQSNESYYRRRAVQELAAARHAVTANARARRRMLAETYVQRLSELTGADESILLDARHLHPQYA